MEDERRAFKKPLTELAAALRRAETGSTVQFDYTQPLKERGGGDCHVVCWASAKTTRPVPRRARDQGHPPCGSQRACSTSLAVVRVWRVGERPAKGRSIVSHKLVP